jgi:hypothetical protein
MMLRLFYGSYPVVAVQLFQTMVSGKYAHGSWRDCAGLCVYLRGFDKKHPFIGTAIEIANRQIARDWAAFCRDDDLESNACKWIPRECSKNGALFDEFAIDWAWNHMPEILRSAAGDERWARAVSKCKREYRRMISQLCRYSDDGVSNDGSVCDIGDLVLSAIRFPEKAQHLQSEWEKLLAISGATSGVAIEIPILCLGSEYVDLTRKHVLQAIGKAILLGQSGKCILFAGHQPIWIKLDDDGGFVLPFVSMVNRVVDSIECSGGSNLDAALLLVQTVSLNKEVRIVGSGRLYPVPEFHDICRDLRERFKQ